MKGLLSPYVVRTMIVILGALLLNSCSNYKRTGKGKPLINRTPGVLIKKNDKSNFVYNYVQIKMDIDIKDENSTESFKAIVKMKKDSLVLISISPALGIEVIRLKLTPSSLEFYSKIPNNKFYYEGTFVDFVEAVGFNLEFSMIQDILVGNAIMLDKQEDKLVSEIDDQLYYLISKLDRKLKRILDKDEKKILPNENVPIALDQFRYQKLRERSDPDELLLKRFWLDPYDYKLTKAKFYDYYNLREVTMEYSDFEETKDQIYPSHGRFKIVDVENNWRELIYEVNKIKVLKELEFIYNVPDDYERKESL